MDGRARDGSRWCGLGLGRSLRVIGLLASAFAPMGVAQPISLPAPPLAGVELTTSHGIQFVTIGNPGNAPIPPAQSPITGTEVGAVGYTYRMARTEVTAQQWGEFVTAYAAAIPASLPSSSWTIDGASLNGNGVLGRDFSNPVFPRGVWTPLIGQTNVPVQISWRAGAIFCNWLHNDRATTWDAFQSGAYDVSTFNRPILGGGNTNPYTDQTAHSPGARFWIPTLDEYVKAAYFNPGVINPVSGEYNFNSLGLNRALAPGLPGQGDALFGLSGSVGSNSIGQYTNSQSPWGLMDTVGTWANWTESGYSSGRHAVGASITSTDAFEDTLVGMVDYWNSPVTGYFGLRIASIPSPGAAVVFGAAVVWCGRRRGGHSTARQSGRRGRSPL